jgi:hypothetical protein
VRRRRPDVDPTELVADGWARLHELIDQYVAAGLTKFVVRPAGGGDLAEFTERFAAELLPREN